MTELEHLKVIRALEKQLLKDGTALLDIIEQEIAKQALEQSEHTRVYSEEEVSIAIDLAWKNPIVSNGTKDRIIQSLSPKSEPRMFSEEEVENIVDKWVRYQEEIGDGKSVPLNEFIKSLSPKETEEQKNQRYTVELIKEIETELQPKESIEAMAEKEVWMPTYWSSPDQVVNRYGNSVQGVERAKGYFLTKEELEKVKSLGRISVINEVEEWRNNERKKLGKITNEHQIKLGKMLILDDLLTKLNNLKAISK